MRESLASRLKALGLSTYAAKTYLALLTHPSTSAGLLCNETGIPDSKMYYALGELARREMIIIQKGTPNTYRSLHPKEAIDNLKEQLAEDLDRRSAQADALADSLSPIFESAEGKEDIELAYIIRGRRNIVSKMKQLICSAKKEVVIFLSEEDLLNELSPFLKESTLHAETRIAIANPLLESPQLKDLGETRGLSCSCNLVIADMHTLITVSDWEEEMAIMTNDKSLITISREYYENPKCCAETR